MVKYVEIALVVFSKKLLIAFSNLLNGGLYEIIIRTKIKLREKT